MKVSKQKVLSIKPESLCKGWAFATIEDMIGEDGVFSDGDWVESKDQDPTGDVRLIQLADIGDGSYRDRSNRFLTRKKAVQLKCTFLTENDVLIARMPDPLGRACIFPGDPKDSVTVVDVCIVRTGESGVNHRWLMFATNSLAIRTAIASLQSGSTRKRISRKNLGRILYPVSPLAEQKRIVAKIEELFTRLDAGVEALKKVRQELKRYRQAVLKYAFEGKLTEQWRENNKDKLEPASKLLEQIAKEREKNTKDTKRKLPPLDISNLPDLPGGWVWANIGMISDNYDFQRVPVKRADRAKMKGHYPYYGASGIIDYVNDFLFDGDYLLIGEDGANLLARTKPLAFQAHGQFWVNNHAHILKTLGEIPLAYLENYVNGIPIDPFVTGTAQPKITQPNLNRISVPVAPSNEQQQIVLEIERHFSIADKIEQTVEQGLKQSNRLRQSILKQAYEGKLVRQDPEDEPAEKLLERIRVEKSKIASRAKKAKKKTAKKPRRKVAVRGSVRSPTKTNVCVKE